MSNRRFRIELNAGPRRHGLDLLHDVAWGVASRWHGARAWLRLPFVRDELRHGHSQRGDDDQASSPQITTNTRVTPGSTHSIRTLVLLGAVWPAREAYNTAAAEKQPFLALASGRGGGKNALQKLRLDQTRCPEPARSLDEVRRMFR